MQVILNGVERTVPDALTVASLVTSLGFAVGSVVVERNGAVVVRSEAASTPVEAGDRMELVRAVAGG